VEQSAPSLYKEILVSPTMITDHFPDWYEKALTNVLDDLLQSKKEK